MSNSVSAVKPRKAIYPGSFDPMTLGHIDLINRISGLYDEVIILVSQANEKSPLFSTEERMRLARESVSHLKNVKIDSFNGLTVEYAKKVNAQVIVRGLRAVVDFEYEISMANINKKLCPEIETVLIFASPEFYFISSRAVKEVFKNKGSLHGLVSDNVALAMNSKGQLL
jgi:pantetheine-phosphate adenylyltransferase